MRPRRRLLLPAAALPLLLLGGSAAGASEGIAGGFTVVPGTRQVLPVVPLQRSLGDPDVEFVAVLLLTGDVEPVTRAYARQICDNGYKDGPQACVAQVTRAGGRVTGTVGGDMFGGGGYARVVVTKKDGAETGQVLIERESGS